MVGGTLPGVVRFCCEMKVSQSGGEPFSGAKGLLNTFADLLRRTTRSQIRTLILTVFAAIGPLKLPHRTERIEPRVK